MKTAIERFWAKVEKTDGDDGCWIWTASVSGPRGYEHGYFYFDDRNQPAHRVSWIIHYGPIPDGHFVLQSCGNRRCINPDHLVLSPTRPYPDHLPCQDLSVRFWSKVNKDGPIPSHRPELGPCWIWTGCRNHSDYGAFFVGRTMPELPRMQASHRMSFILTFGMIPKDICVLHDCDNPPCVRPSHLFVGTRGDNYDDSVAKNRAGLPHVQQPIGEDHGMAKITEADVLQIRSLHGAMTQKQVADKYNIGKSQVERIQYKKSWTHLD